MDEHVIEALGRAKITIKDGKVVDVGEPMIEYCPLFHKMISECASLIVN